MPEHAESRPVARTWAYVGCRTSSERRARGRAVEVYEVQRDAWRHRFSVPAGINPSYLLVAPAAGTLHCVHGDETQVSSFRIQPDGDLRHLGEQPTHGRNPVHLASSPDGRWVIVANYASGSLTVHPVGESGALERASQVLELPGDPGPHRLQQKGSHPHQVVFDPSGRWLLVPDKGADRVHTLRLDAQAGRLQWVAATRLPEGSGPRHLVFGGTVAGAGGWMVLELSSQVVSFGFELRTGNLTARQRMSSVPDSFVGDNTAAGIAYLPEAGRVAVSNRGHGSIAWFRALPDGSLAPPQWTSTGGRVPRFITPNGHGELLVANEDADRIERLKPGAGAPQCLHLADTGSPVCIALLQGTP
ncbi:lactonase family protein [Pseudacidovorax sp. 1753]|uniref:lactonase family protein n=1 Tax=Pseudacidovorax sp. 1753 TaxID=3156419 RepID=UPI0033947325